MSTSQYYSDNAEEFYKSTVNADMSATYDRFLKYIPHGSKILDFGCGSGRDSKAFIGMGYLVEAVDGSEELCRLASELLGMEVKCMDFKELNKLSEYNAIWACASLLHIPSIELPQLLEKMKDSIDGNGVMYISFKHGDYEGWRNGRFFVDMTSEGFSKILSKVDGVYLLEEWYSEDVRNENNTKWYNVIVGKGKTNGFFSKC
ncbi:MAG: class I SAM-dependent methyltransferase [Clostridia bacterium]|nr:class I SAM-dependent methyltransferase [Clostridia bacterium]